MAMTEPDACMTLCAIVFFALSSRVAGSLPYIILAMTIANGTILDSTLGPIALALEHLGVDASVVFTESYVAFPAIGSAPQRVPLPKYLGLMSRCVAATGREDFGLLAAHELQPQSLRSLGLGWLASDSVLEGLRRLTRFNRLVASLSRVELREQDDLVILEAASQYESHLGFYASRDYAVGMIVRMCRLTLGEYLAPLRIELQRPEPQNSRPWTYQLGSVVQFNCEVGRMVWVRSDIEEKLPTGDPQLARLMDEQAEAYIASQLDNKIHSSMLGHVLLRLPDGPPSLSAIADDMHMSPRTLQRRLSSEGTTFESVLQDARITMAQRYLRQGRHSVQEVAYLLGFSEASAFSRAFKRWTGKSPTYFRDGGSGAESIRSAG